MASGLGRAAVRERRAGVREAAVVEILELTARDGQLDLSTTSGEIEYQGSLASASGNTLDSISGDVNLRLPENSDSSLIGGNFMWQ